MATIASEDRRKTVESTTRDDVIVGLWLRRQRSELTRSAYRRDINRLTRYCEKSLNALTLDDLQGFADALAADALAPISQARTLAAVRSLLRFACRVGHVAANLGTELVLPVEENRLAEKIISEAEVRRMIEFEPHARNRVLLKLLYGAGLRTSETCNLRWRNLQVKGSAGQITVLGKGRKTRSITLPALLWADLLSLKEAAALGDPVFASRTGKPLDRSRVLTVVHESARRAGIEANVTTHWLRHATCFALARSRRADSSRADNSRSHIGCYDQPVSSRHCADYV